MTERPSVWGGTREIIELISLLADRIERVSRLPMGSDRQTALAQVAGFHAKVAALVERTAA